MRTRARNPFTTIRTEGGLFPVEFLQRIGEGDKSIDGLKPEDYHLPGNIKLSEAINPSWNVLLGAWEAFKAASEKLPENDPGTTVTRERWLLPLFNELGYGRLQTAKAIEIEEKSYPVSHSWSHLPIHLVGFNVDLDRRSAGVAGAARVSPHGMVQELLNRSDKHLWAFLSNGYRLRILRDNATLTRQAFVEFDLYAMMEGEVYSDFIILWLLCHQSRVEGERPDAYRLEKWMAKAADQGTRALEHLRSGVDSAISALGSGFLSHPANGGIKEKLRSGALTKQDFYRQILRVVYRIIFLFVAEDRDLLFPPKADTKAKKRYLDYYSTRRLRKLAERKSGTKHSDLWNMLRFVFRALGNPDGCSPLALPSFGSQLWSEGFCPDIDRCEIANRDLLDAIRNLAVIVDGEVRRIVDYRNLGSEELGSIYESLLEMHPEVHIESGKFELNVTAGNERKTTGSYYTPTSLVNCLLDSALDPVIEDRLKSVKRSKSKEDDYRVAQEQTLLSLKICDPACGSGHFLIAAAHRVAKRLASIRTGDDEPSPSATQKALRDVVGHCIYGVDINPMAVELCKISLWMEAMEPGKPLSFLDHHIRVGNSLIGATPELIAEGLPDETYTPIEGDDREACAALKRINRAQREALRHLFVAEDNAIRERLRRSATAIDEMDDSRPEAVKVKEAAFISSESDYEYLKARTLANLWCAAFVIKKRFADNTAAISVGTSHTVEQAPSATTIETGLFGAIGEIPKAKAKRGRPARHSPFETPIGITTQHLRDYVHGVALPQSLLAEVHNLAASYRFFHWHLAFPEVFSSQATASNNVEKNPGGFDVVLANPPWERVKLQEKEWFAERSPDIANAPNAAARKRLIEALKSGNSALYREFLADSRKAEGESQLLRNSGRYPLCGRGDINTYAVFAEGMRNLLNEYGRVGCILPSGIATDDTTKYFFQNVIDRKSLISLFDFENKGIFPGVHSSYKFCLFTGGNGIHPMADRAEFVFFAHGRENLRDPERRFTLNAEDITRLNPNTRTCPIFRSRLDAELTKAIYRHVPVLIREGYGDQPEENSWGITFSRMFDMSNDSHLFRTREQLESDGWRLQGNIFRKNDAGYLPLYEGRLGHQFNHRFASESQGNLIELTDDQLDNAFYYVQPQYWVDRGKTEEHLSRREVRCRYGLLGYRRVSCNTNERTCIAAIIPWGAASYGWIISFGPDSSGLELLCGIYNSYPFDYLLRNSLSQPSIPQGTFEQIPALPPSIFAQSCLWSNSSRMLRDWLLPRILELTYSAWDLESFAKDCGCSGPPFRWDEERRFWIRAELDAAFFHLNLGMPEDWAKEPAALRDSFPTPRDAVSYIMDTFPIVKRKDEKKYGTYRTKEAILSIYDDMATAIRTGKPYQTRLNPPPGTPADENGNFLPLPEWKPGQPKPPNWPPHIHPPRGCKE